MAFVLPPSMAADHAARQTFGAFCDGFESTFGDVATGGTLNCSAEQCIITEQWFNSNLLQISLVLGISVQPIVFHNGPAHNRLIMTHCYALAFTAYLRYCRTLGRTARSCFAATVQASE
jgi:hypothetical protein